MWCEEHNPRRDGTLLVWFCVQKDHSLKHVGVCGVRSPTGGGLGRTELRLSVVYHRVVYYITHIPWLHPL